MGVAEFLGSGLLSLAIGGLIGLERQRVPKRVLGTRTFALVSFLGFLLAFFSQGAWWLPAIGLVGCFALAVGYYYFRVKRSYYLSESIGLTTPFMLPLSFFLGVLVGYDFFLEAGLSAIAAVYLLLEKREVHAFAKTISKQEIIDLLLFVIIAFIVYPQLPVVPVNVLGFVFDLRYFWTIVVLVSSISFISHFLTKYVKHNAVFYSAVLGGLVSSLATVSLFVSKTRDKTVLYSVLAASSLSSLASNILLLLLIAPTIFRELGLVLFLQLLGFVAVTWYYYRKSHAIRELLPAEKRALSLKFTFEFAIVFFAVSLLISFSSQSLFVLLLSAFLGGVISSTSVFAAISYQHAAGGLPQALTALALIATVVGSQFSKSFVLWLALGKRSVQELSLMVVATAALGFIGYFLHGL